MAPECVEVYLGLFLEFKLENLNPRFLGENQLFQNHFEAKSPIDS